VASPGTIGLNRMIRLARRPPLPLAGPVFSTATRALRRVGLPELSADFMRLLRYGRAVDTSRLVDEVGYSPVYTTPTAVEEFASGELPVREAA
jgi:UDP-glucose 4-epimerase